MSEGPHVCIVLLTGLGDVVNGLPLVNALREAMPGMHLTWVAEPMPAEVLEGHSAIDRVVIYRRSEGLRGIRQLRRDLRKGSDIDITLNLNVYIKSIWPTLLSRAPRRIGFERGRAFEGVWLAATETLRPAPRAHTADMFLEFARQLGIPADVPTWRLSFDDARASANEFLDGVSGKPLATIIPASGSIKKDWIASRWAEVADSLELDFGFSVVVAGGPGDREQALAREIVSISSARIHWAMGDSVRRLGAIIGASRMVIAPDTGPVHIARALDVPVIGLYGHTNPWRVGPWRAYEDLWVDNYTEPGEQGDPSNRTPKWNRMPTITVQQVLEKVNHAVARYGVSPNRTAI